MFVRCRIACVAALASLTLFACDDGSQLDGELVFVEGADRDLKVLSVRPDSGPLVGGTLLVLTGEGFEPDMNVTFDGNGATQLYVGGDELAAMLTPAGAAPGTVDTPMLTRQIDHPR